MIMFKYIWSLFHIFNHCSVRIPFEHFWFIHATSIDRRLCRKIYGGKYCLLNYQVSCSNKTSQSVNIFTNTGNHRYSLCNYKKHLQYYYYPRCKIIIVSGTKRAHETALRPSTVSWCSDLTEMTNDSNLFMRLNKKTSL